jgi:hypothetical protein
MLGGVLRVRLIRSLNFLHYRSPVTPGLSFLSDLFYRIRTNLKINIIMTPQDNIAQRGEESNKSR